MNPERKVVVVNTGPLILLEKIGAVDIAGQLFNSRWTTAYGMSASTICAAGAWHTRSVSASPVCWGFWLRQSSSALFPVSLR